MEFTAPQPRPFPLSDPHRDPRPPAPVRRRLASTAAAAALLGAAVFAGSQLGGTGSGHSTSATSTNLPLSARVLAPSALPGFMLTADAAPVHSASEWALVGRSRTPVRETARLRSLGFTAGYDEQLHGRYPVAASAVSVVERYRTAAGARGELAYRYRQLQLQPGAKVTTFSVPGIPGAHGVRVDSRGNVDMNIVFASGSYFYVVGAGFPAGAHGAPGQAQLSTAAATLYLSGMGCVANVSQTA
jgi:hypothetical protein